MLNPNAQVKRCADAGADIVRITVQGTKEAEACGKIRDKLFQQGCVVYTEGAAPHDLCMRESAHAVCAISKVGPCICAVPGLWPHLVGGDTLVRTFPTLRPSCTWTTR